MAGKIIADIIESAGSQISLNVGNVTILTASSTGLTLTPTSNVNINVSNSSVTFTNATVTGIATFAAGSNTAPSITTAGDTNTGIFFPAADTIAFSEGGVESMRIDSSGNLGIGTTTPTRKLTIAGTGAFSSTTAPAIRFDDTASGRLALIDFDSSQNLNILASTDSGAIRFLTNTGAGTERARIDINGSLFLGRTNQLSSERFGIEVSGSNQLAYLRSTGTSGDPTLFRIASGVLSGAIGASGNFIYCEDGGSAKFYVKGNGGIANFSASNTNLSDRREKTNFAPAGEYLSKICNIPVQTFNYIDQDLEDDGDLTLGVVAQDVQAVAPELVTESNWGNEEEPKMRLSIYQTDLQYALMKCIQELKVIVDAQAVEIAALKAK
jgi:hypothetical protein